MAEPVAIGVDVGGTKVAVGAVRADGDLEHRIQLATAQATPRDVANAAASVAAQLGEDAEVLGVGVGICELVHDGEVRSATSVPWTTSELAEALAGIGPVAVEADVVAAAAAEAAFGAGRAFSSFLYITVGTGISHCLVVAGEPYRGAHGCAQLSGSARLTLRCSHCGERVELSVEEVASGAAVAGASDGVAALEEAAVSLGALIALLVNVLDPEAVVVGGGLGSAGGAYWDALVRATREHVWAEHVADLPILRAGLGRDSGLVGAGWLGLRAAAAHDDRMRRGSVT
jgi:glucokinase